MSVRAVGPYAPPARQIRSSATRAHLYLAWDEHLMFCAPLCVSVSLELPFAALIEQVLPKTFGDHPEFARINWNEAEWFKSGQPWRPDLQRSLHDNGLQTSHMLRLHTPGLHGIGGSGS
jgi:phenol hydroxylase P4 protein